MAGGDVGTVKAAVEVDAAAAGRVGKVLSAHICLDLTTRLKVSLSRSPVR
jgi:microcompartment protein CcmL/EutN